MNSARTKAWSPIKRQLSASTGGLTITKSKESKHISKKGMEIE